MERKIIKTFIALIFMVALTLAFGTTSVFAATQTFDISPNSDGAVIAEFDDVTGVLTVKGEGPTRNYKHDYELPWGNLPLRIKEIVISEGITTIENRLFCFGWYQGSYCSFVSLEKITLPTTLTKIGEKAFCGSNSGFNSKLREIIIPKNVETIGYEAFSYHDNLENIEFAEGSKLSSIEDYAFRRNKSDFEHTFENDIVLPSTVKSIGNYAFSSSKSNIILNEGLESIGHDAFSSSNLESIVIPESVTSIGENAFSDMRNLKVITILSKNPQNVKPSPGLYAINPIVYLYSTNTGFINITSDMGAGTKVIFLDEPVLSGTLENGIKWTYDPDTKTITFEGEGEIPSYTPGSQPWFGAYYHYGSASGYDFGSVSGIGSGAFTGLGGAGSNVDYYGQNSGLGSILGDQLGTTPSYGGESPTTTPPEDKTGIWNYVDDIEVQFPDVQPRVQNGEIISPLRFIFQDLGATVLWNQDGNYAIVRKEEKGKKVEIVLKPDSSSMWVNGQEYTNQEIGLDATVKIENGRLLLPGRAIVKAWETVRFKAERPSVTVYEDYYYKSDTPVVGEDSKLPNIPEIPDWKEDGTPVTPDNEEEVVGGGSGSTGGNDKETSIVVNAEPTNFKVTVPIAVAVSMDANGVITVAKTDGIKNLCPLGPVIVTKIKVVTAVSWDLSDFNADYLNMTASKKTFGISINGSEVSTTGAVVLNDSLKSVIKNQESKELDIVVKLPAQKTSLNSLRVAGIIYTVDFNKI